MTTQNNDNAEVSRTLLDKYRTDPVFFVEHALGHLTWSKQRDILHSVCENEKTAVRACHGASKTFTGAEITAWFLNSFHSSKVVTTAPTNDQVELLLWSEINKIYASSRIQLEGECQVKKIKTAEADHFAVGFSTDKPARAEGWHAPSILFIFDEAKGIPQWMWDSVRGLMTGGFCRWLVISTTDGVAVGENYYKIFEREDSGWNRIHISAHDTPYSTGEKFQGIDLPDLSRPDVFSRKEVDPKDIVIQIAGPKYIADSAKEWGKDSPLFLTKVLGEISDQGADTIIKLSQVCQMNDNANDPSFDDSGAVEVGVDVARGGEDDTVFYKRKGYKVIGKKTITTPQLPPTAITVHLANELEVFTDHNHETSMKIDDTGVGGGLSDTMESRGYNVVKVNFQQKSRMPDKYPNVISEMWFEVAKIIQEISCPEYDRLKSELVNRKGEFDKKGRRVVESKDDYKRRGFRSPDEADAFLLAFHESESGGFEILG